jgi:uncharacterized protein
MPYTTIALRPATKERLESLKRKWRLRSMDDLVLQLLAAPPATAQQLFQSHHDQVMAVLRKHGVTKVVAFGSRARGDARPDSDLDLMVHLPAGSSLFDQANLMADLEEVFGLPVDVVTPGRHLGPMAARIARDGVVLVG